MQQINNKDKGMSASEITRKRLNSLRALTEELRDRTKNAPLDLSHIRELLSNTRQLHTSQAHRPPPAPDAADNLHTDSAMRLPPKQTDAEEDVVLLRQENIALERRIAQLREEVGRLEEEKRKQEAAAQNNSTYCFKISDSVEGFVGRLAIPAEDYDRLEYSGYDMELRLDRLVLLRREKGAVQEFELCGLRGAEYCGLVMVLRFEEFLEESSLHPPTSVFLKFHSEDQLQKWDLALYSNYHIVTSLDQKRLFEKYFRCLKLDQQAHAEKERIQAIRESVELDRNKEKDLLKLLLQKREELLEVKQLINEKLDHKIKAKIALSKEERELVGEEKVEHPDNPKQDPSSNIKPTSNLTSTSPIERIVEMEPHQEESERGVQPASYLSQPPLQNSQAHHSFHMRHTDSNMVNYSDPFNPSFNSPDPRASKLAPIAQMRSSNVQHGNFPLSPPPFIPGSQSQLRESKATLVNQLNIGDGRTQSVEQSSRNNSISKFKQASQDRLNAARVRLQNGYYATKYSKDGFSPHDKKVFLSLDSKKLCWSDRDKQSEYKSVPIAVLIGVQYGVVGEGIAKHVKNPDSRYFCVIEYYTSDYKKKTIQLGSGNLQDIKDLAAELTTIIHHRQPMAPS